MNKIKLFNRDGADLYLIPKEDYYVLEGPKSYLSYIRVIFDGAWNKDNQNIRAIDPPGGPFISVGDVFENKKVNKITSKVGEGVRIYLEDK